MQSVLGDHSIQDFLGRGPVTLVAAGKATHGMIQGFLASNDFSIRRGIAVGVEKGAGVPSPIVWYRGGHPVPVRGSVEAGRAALRCAAGVSSSECLVVLLSGGASALMAVPAGAVTLEEKVAAMNNKVSAEPKTQTEAGCKAETNEGIELSGKVNTVDVDAVKLNSAGSTVGATGTAADTAALHGIAVGTNVQP